MSYKNTERTEALTPINCARQVYPETGRDFVLPIEAWILPIKRLDLYNKSRMS